jgi:hypothetical protein
MGLLKDVELGKTRMIALHVIAPNLASLNEIEPTRVMLQNGATHIIVKNFINETKFFDVDPEVKANFLDKLDPTRVVNVAHPPSIATEKVEAKSAMFSAFADDDTNSRVLRGYVNQWLAYVHAEFDRVGLPALQGG